MSYERLVHCVLLALIIVGPALRGTIHEEERRLKKNILLFVGIPVISLAITACGGGKKEDPVELITSAAVEETTIEETSTAEETGVELSEVSVLEAGPGVESEYIYQQIDDDQVHKVTFWTDGETRLTDYFRNLYLPAWGIKKITLPADLLDESRYVLNPGEEINSELIDKYRNIDASASYDGNFCLKTDYSEFKVWRVNVGRRFEPREMTPYEVFLNIYPFYDKAKYLTNVSQYWDYTDENGVAGYIFQAKDSGHWEENVMYTTYILVRVSDGVAHCVQYGESTDSASKAWDYIIKTAELTKVSEITEGKICSVNK